MRHRSDWESTQRYFDQLWEARKKSEVPNRVGLVYGRRAKKSTVKILLDENKNLAPQQRENLQQYLNSFSSKASKPPIEKVNKLLKKWGMSDEDKKPTSKGETVVIATEKYERKTIPTPVIRAEKISSSEDKWIDTINEEEKEKLREKLAQEWRETHNEWSKDRLGHLKSVGNGL